MDTVDNFDTLRNILEFPTKDVFYVISIIQRPKDFVEGFTERRHKEHFIKHYFVRSVKELDDLKPKIIECCKLYNARAYLGLDAKNIKKVISKTIQDEAELLLLDGDQAISRYKKNYHSICRQAECSETSLRFVHLDLDRSGTEGYDLALDLEAKLLEFSHRWRVLNSPNGYHFISKIRSNEGNVNIQELGNFLKKYKEENSLGETELEMKMNSMVVLYK